VAINSKSNMTAPSIVLVVSVVLFLLSIGLCGMGAVSGGTGTLIGLGLTCLGLSILSFGVGIVWLIVVAIGNRRR
jgi:hypothetical protein